MKRFIFALLLACIPGVAYALTQAFTITVAINALTPLFNCSGFASSGACGVSLIGGGGLNFSINGSPNGASPGLVGSQVNLLPTGFSHQANNLNYRVTQVSAQQFSTTFTFIPNGWNIAFILSNNTNPSGFPASGGFSAGAGCESSFFQGFATSGLGPPNNTFALELDSQSGLPAGVSTFTYSSVQYYDTGHDPTNPPNPPGRSPCNSDLGGDGTWTYIGVNKVSTSPVALNSPANVGITTTGHVYSATITYDGSNLTISLFDVTAGGACPGAACFTNTWTGVNIPAIVGSNTAWAGLGGGNNSTVPALFVNSWSFSQ